MDLINTPIVANLGIFEVMSDWNIVLMIIGACSVFSFAIFFERLITLRRCEINTDAFITDLRKTIQKGYILEAIQHCDRTGGTVPAIIKSGLNKHDQGQEKIENAMEVTGMIEIAQLEKNAKTLSIIAHVAPLIGLLGTVLGFIQAFAEMRQSGLMDISTTNIGAAMEYALETTAAGLAVAIPTVVAYNYIVSRIEGFLLDIQTTSSEVVDLLMTHQETLKLNTKKK
jgi:biopolymer transport protein ExbB